MFSRFILSNIFLYSIEKEKRSREKRMGTGRRRLTRRGRGRRMKKRRRDVWEEGKYYFAYALKQILLQLIRQYTVM